jgi:hypothetical protein
MQRKLTPIVRDRILTWLGALFGLLVLVFATLGVMHKVSPADAARFAGGSAVIACLTIMFRTRQAR